MKQETAGLIYINFLEVVHLYMVCRGFLKIKWIGNVEDIFKIQQLLKVDFYNHQYSIKHLLCDFSKYSLPYFHNFCILGVGGGMILKT